MMSIQCFSKEMGGSHPQGNGDVMQDALRSAIERAVLTVKSEGCVLDVNATLSRLGMVDERIGATDDEIALALIKEASRRQVAFAFHALTT